MVTWNRPGITRPTWAYLTRQVMWAGLDLLFPPRCGGCQQTGHRFCAVCQAGLSYIVAPICSQCGYPNSPLAACTQCASPFSATNAQTLHGLRSAVFFEGPARQALHRLKYQRDVSLADALAHLLFQAWKRFELPKGIVIPIPLSQQRIQARGYNQAALLAQGLADLAHLPYTSAHLKRIRHTQSQVELSAAERQTNVAEAFKAHPTHLQGRIIILVDDVCTTGATLAAAATALSQAGAAQVWGLTLARAR